LKQIEPVGPAGEALMDYSIYDALRAGFGKLVFVIRKDIEKSFRETVAARFAHRVAVEYAFQELGTLPPGFSAPPHRTKPWGTAHAILVAENTIHEPFAAINADDFYGADSFRVLAQHLQTRSADYAMVGFTLHNTLSEFGSVARGVCEVGAEGFLRTVTELTQIEKDGAGARYQDASGHWHQIGGNTPVSMNLWGFTPALFPQLRRQFADFLTQHGQEEKNECYIPACVNELIKTGQARCRVLPTTASWFGVTYPQDRIRVIESIRELVRRGAYPANLWG
jgi:dTDP-glucose pyrophosphorylase